MNQTTIRYRTLDSASIVRDVLRQWWGILLFSLAVALLVNVAANSLYKPMYTTSTTFVVTTRGTNTSIYQNITSASDTAERFQTVLESNILKRTIAKDLGIKSFDAISSVELLEETNLIVLKVSHRSALMAYRYLQSIMNNYSTVSNYVIRDVVLEVLEQPRIPMAPSNVNRAQFFMYIGFLGGLIISILYVAFFSYLKDTVKNSNEATSKLAARFLGSIYHEARGTERRRNRVTAMVISNPILSMRYTESCRMVASRVRSRMDRKGAKTVLITSVAENEGKSTVASNIALALAQEGNNVLLIDADFRKPSLYKIFDIDKNQIINLVEILRTGKGLNKAVIRLKRHPLYFILNNTNTGTIDDILANDRFEALINFAHRQFDYVIIDTAPMGLVPDAEGIAEFCDASIIVVREDTILAKNINDAIDTLNDTKAKVLGVIFNDARGRHNLSVRSNSAYGFDRRH